jgi:hypothetical protein
VLGIDHPNTLLSVNNLSFVFGCQGKYEEAEVMHRRALAGRETVLGVDHPDTGKCEQPGLDASMGPGRHRDGARG